MVFGVHLISEITNATQLVAIGLNQVVHPDWSSSEPASAFTCLASGVERILKLTYGVDLLDRGAPFPNDKELRQLGHDLVGLEGTVTPQLIARARAKGNNYVSELLTNADSDRYWPGLLATLNAWAAASGRYRDLTILSGGVAPVDAPGDAWEDTERACITDLGLWPDVAGPNNRVALVQARTRLSRSLLMWWHAIFRTWTHGLLGESRISPGTALSPTANRYLSKPLADLVKSL